MLCMLGFVAAKSRGALLLLISFVHHASRICRPELHIIEKP